MRCSIAIAFILGLLAGCSGASPSHRRTTSTRTAHQRIVTLVPSFADDIVALGAGPQLVGVSAFTDAPGTKLVARVADAAGVDTEAILLLRPTIVFGIPSQWRFVQVLRHAGIPVALLPDDTYDEIFRTYEASVR